MPERLIDANALMRRVCEKECGPHFNIDLCDLDDDSTDTRCVFREYVRSEPTIEPEVRHGRWIELPKALNPEENPCECSACGHILSFYGYYPKSRYCPNCGSKMDADMREEGADNG